jgi:trk system potassium uptake protein TrkA
MVKRLIIIGLGNFGSTLAKRLYETGQEVIAIDARPDVVDAIGPKVTRALVGDATNKAVLEAAGAREADAAVISTGDDLAASILALLALRDLKVKAIYVKVISDEHARIVDSLGAEESIFPERESALGLASRMTARVLLQYVKLGPKLSIQEMAVPLAWQGKTLRDLSLPKRYQTQVVALHDMLRDEMIPVPPDRPLTASDALLLAGDPEILNDLAKIE